MICRILFLIFLVAAQVIVYGQTEQETPENLEVQLRFEPKLLFKISAQVARIENSLKRKTQKALLRMRKQEQKLNETLDKHKGQPGEKLVSGKEFNYDELLARLDDKIPKQSINLNGFYIPQLDSLATALKFLSKAESIAGSKELPLFQDAIAKVDGLGDKLEMLHSVGQTLQQRKEYLIGQLKNHGLARRIIKLNKGTYYFNQLIAEYRSIINDPKQLGAKLVSTLRELPAFRKFLNQHSQLASVFGMPVNNQGQVSFAGIQSRGSVQQIIQTFPTSGGRSHEFLNKQLDHGSGKLSAKKTNPFLINHGKSEGSNDPGFRTNSQKTKSFLKRLEYGANIQFGKVNRFLPTTCELALSLGYKLNDKSTFGIATAYKLGLGSGFDNISFSSQGYGLRSHFEWNIKGGYHIYGGYEKNNLPQLQQIATNLHIPQWQESGLIGITRKYPIKGRNAMIQVLFDFLSFDNLPRSQPILVRTGISF